MNGAGFLVANLSRTAGGAARAPEILCISFNVARMTSSEFSFEIPGFTIAALRFGNPTGQKILALHGWLDNAATFVPLAALLPEFDIVAVDLPGHGKSTHRAPGDSYEFITWVPVVANMLHALGWDRCILMGHSMGAAIAGLVGGVLPERFSHVVMLEGIGPLNGEPSSAVQQTRKSLAAMAEFPQMRPKLYPALEDCKSRVRNNNPTLAPHSVDLLVERATHAVPGGFQFRHDQRLRLPSLIRFSEDQILSYLQALTSPTLMVRAETGWPFPLDLVQARTESVPDRRVVTVPGFHHVHLDSPAVFIDELRKFLNVDAA
jgi:pimeloyl-ACP methyl ester carboxylesterase